MQVDIKYKNEVISSTTKPDKIFLNTKDKLMEDYLWVQVDAEEWAGDFKNNGSITINTTAFNDIDFYTAVNPKLHANVAIVNEEGTVISTTTTGLLVSVSPVSVDEKFSLNPIQAITNGIIDIDINNLYPDAVYEWDTNTIRLTVTYTNPSGIVISTSLNITLRTKYSKPKVSTIEITTDATYEFDFLNAATLNITAGLVFKNSIGGTVSEIDTTKLQVTLSPGTVSGYWTSSLISKTASLALYGITSDYLLYDTNWTTTNTIITVIYTNADNTLATATAQFLLKTKNTAAEVPKVTTIDLSITPILELDFSSATTLTITAGFIFKDQFGATMTNVVAENIAVTFTPTTVTNIYTSALNSKTASQVLYNITSAYPSTDDNWTSTNATLTVTYTNTDSTLVTEPFAITLKTKKSAATDLNKVTSITFSNETVYIDLSDRERDSWFTKYLHFYNVNNTELTSGSIDVSKIAAVLSPMLLANVFTISEENIDIYQEGDEPPYNYGIDVSFTDVAPSYFSEPVITNMTLEISYTNTDSTVVTSGPISFSANIVCIGEEEEDPEPEDTYDYYIYYMDASGTGVWEDTENCILEDEFSDIEPSSYCYKPDDPEAEGYVFEGWYLDSALTNSVEWDEDDLTLINEGDTYFYAKFTAE